MSPIASCVIAPTTATWTVPLLTPPAVQPEVQDSAVATISASQVVAPAVSTPMSAADATALLTRSRDADPTKLQSKQKLSSSATAARSKAFQQSYSQRPVVSTPIDIDVLERQLLHHITLIVTLLIV